MPIRVSIFADFNTFAIKLDLAFAEHCGREDTEVACNAFVINALIGIALYVVFVYAIGAAV